MSDISKKLKNALRGTKDDKAWDGGQKGDELQGGEPMRDDQQENITNDELLDNDDSALDDDNYQLDDNADSEIQDGMKDKLKKVITGKFGFIIIAIIVVLVLAGVKYLTKHHTDVQNSNGQATQQQTFGGSYAPPATTPSVEKIPANSSSANATPLPSETSMSTAGLPKGTKLKPLPNTNAQYKGIKEQLDKLQSHVSGMTSTVSTLSKTVNGIQSKVGTQGNKIKSLNKLVGLNTNQEAGSSVSTVIPSFVSKNSDNKDEQRLNNAVNDNTKQVTQLQQAVDTLSNDVKQLSGRLQTQNQNLIKLAVQVNKVNGNLNKLTKVVGNYVSTKTGTVKLLGTFQNQSGNWIAQLYYKGQIMDVGENESKGSLHIGQVTANGAVINNSMYTITSDPVTH
jgi:peptidoglycan hydrolase CwlO-like protein